MLTNHSLNDTETRNEANGRVGGQYTMHVRWVLGVNQDISKPSTCRAQMACAARYGMNPRRLQAVDHVCHCYGLENMSHTDGRLTSIISVILCIDQASVFV